VKRRRDRQNELVVALVVAIAMGFALVFSIVLSIGDDKDEESSTSIPVEGSQVPSLLPGITPTREATPLPSPEPSNTPAPRRTFQPTSQVEDTTSPEPIDIPTQKPTEIAQISPTEANTPSATPSPSKTLTLTPTPTATASNTPTHTHTSTHTPSPTVTATQTPSHTPTATATPTATLTRTPTPTITLTPFGKPRTPAVTPTLVVTHTPLVSTLPAGLAGVVATEELEAEPTITSTQAATATTVAIAITPNLVKTQEPTCTPRSDWDIYIIDVGDTFFSIAQRAGVSMAELQAANCIENPERIFAGQPLRVPPGGVLPVSIADAAIENCNVPDAILTAPKAGEALDGFVVLRGVARGAGFRRYILDWRPDDPAIDYKSFAEVFQIILEEGDLGRFNTDAFDPGLYWFRLRVLETNDYIIGECSIRVRFR
jgi:LysM repeat protein